MAYLSSVLPQVRVLSETDTPSAGFVRRLYAVNPDIVVHAPWWPIQEHQRISSDSDMVILWIPKADNLAYERGEHFRKQHIVHRKRWCDARWKITALARGHSRWFPVKDYFTAVSSIHSVMQAYPSRKLSYFRIKRGTKSGVMVKRTQ